jgi:phosphate butyryltransferase
MIDHISAFEGISLSVAAAHDRDVLKAVASAHKMSGVRPVLFGDARIIEGLLNDIGFDGTSTVIDEPDDVSAARAAVKYVHDGGADVLMKGLVNTRDFMRAVLDREIGLRTGGILSHLGAFEISGLSRLIFVTDGGINIEPDLEEKKEILENALAALKKMGHEYPKVAVLAANELVNSKARATVDASSLAEAWKAGEFGPDCIVEGPMALDVALSAEAADHKHISSLVAGRSDILLTPTIEVGNVLGKCMTYLAGAKMAGVVLGASAPIILTSRYAPAVTKLNSIMLSVCCA